MFCISLKKAVSLKNHWDLHEALGKLEYSVLDKCDFYNFKEDGNI